MLSRTTACCPAFRRFSGTTKVSRLANWSERPSYFAAVSFGVPFPASPASINAIDAQLVATVEIH
jgi:hypothetical protein